MRETNAIHHVVATWLSVALLLVQSLVYAETDTLERIEWKKAPIRLELAVGQEQRIEFPSTVKVGVPGSLQPLLRTQSVNGMVYLLAHASFGSNRLMMRELDSGRIYLFDVTAVEEGGTTHSIQIYNTSGFAKDVVAGDNDAGAGQPGYIQLTRFAAQQLYAPARLVKDRPGIVRVPVSRDAVNLFYGGAIEATDPGSARPARCLAERNLSASPLIAHGR